MPEAEKAHREALAVLEKLDPKNAAAWFSRGVRYSGLHEYDKAIADLNKAIKLEPKSAPAHCELGVAFCKQRKLDEAVAEFRKAIDLDPKLALAHNNLGNALRGQGKLDEAVTAYRKAIALKPDYAEAHCNLGHALRQQGEVPRGPGGIAPRPRTRLQAPRLDLPLGTMGAAVRAPDRTGREVAQLPRRQNHSCERRRTDRTGAAVPVIPQAVRGHRPLLRGSFHRRAEAV
jgi:tetratricopeptide (TPR) repeat protein